MAWIKYSSPLTTLTLVLTLGVVSSIPTGVQALPVRSSLSDRLDQLNFKPPVRPGGNPDNLEGGATRGPDEGQDDIRVNSNNTCLSSQQSLAALVPYNSNWSTTLSAYPSFFLYLPETSARQAEFVLKNDAGKPVYKTRFAISGKRGIVSLDLPAFANLSPLEVDKEYEWELKLMCNPRSRNSTSNPVVEGSVTRIQPDPALAARINRATPKERALLYANAGVWYETISTLVELRRLYPNDRSIASALENLLESVGLGDIAQESLDRDTTQTSSSN